MSDREQAGDPADVGVVAPDDADAVVESVEAAGGRARAGDAEAVVAADPDAVVAVGEPALLALVRAGVSVPVLPVEAGRGVRSVAREDLDAAIEHLLAGDHRPVDYPLIGPSLESVEARAFMDLALLPAEPARISEYTVETGGEPVARFRADGVVVATPAGSRGYARAAGGPVLAPGTGVLAVVPIAPFAIDSDRWVLPLGAVTLTVERDEVDVEVLADDRTVGRAPPGERLPIERRGTLTVATVAESRPAFGTE